eukprot:403370807
MIVQETDYERNMLSQKTRNQDLNEFSEYNKEVSQSVNPNKQLSNENEGLTPAIDINIKDQKQILYYMEIYLGSHQQLFEMRLDFQSYETQVITTDCNGCQYTDQFDFHNSKSNKVLTDLTKPDMVFHTSYDAKYEQIAYQALRMNDTLCIDDLEQCMIEFQFYGALTDPNFEEKDGVIGIKPFQGKSFLEQLFYAQIIDNLVFGLFLRSKDNYLDSQLRLGGYNPDLMQNYSDLKFFKMPIKDNLSLHIYDALFDDISFFNKQPGKLVEFNANELYLSIPRDEFKKLVNLFIRDDPTQIDSCKIYTCLRNTPCSQVPDIPLRFVIGDEENQVTVTIPTRTYLFDAKQVGIKGDYCILGVQGTVPSKQNKYVFGALFMQQYYSVFDLQHQKIGFTKAKKLTEFEAKKNIETWIIVAIFLSAFLTLILLTLCIIYSIRRVLNKKVKIRPKSDEEKHFSMYSQNNYSKLGGFAINDESVDTHSEYVKRSKYSQQQQQNMIMHQKFLSQNYNNINSPLFKLGKWNEQSPFSPITNQESPSSQLNNQDEEIIDERRQNQNLKDNSRSPTKSPTKSNNTRNNTQLSKKSNNHEFYINDSNNIMTQLLKLEQTDEQNQKYLQQTSSNINSKVNTKTPTTPNNYSQQTSQANSRKQSKLRQFITGGRSKNNTQKINHKQISRQESQISQQQEEQEKQIQLQKQLAFEKEQKQELMNQDLDLNESIDGLSGINGQAQSAITGNIFHVQELKLDEHFM